MTARFIALYETPADPADRMPPAPLRPVARAAGPRGLGSRWSVL
ncbi:hypothetical protein ACFYMW_06590 [Streptomyces sp. NPDC006692]